MAGSLNVADYLRNDVDPASPWYVLSARYLEEIINDVTDSVETVILSRKEITPITHYII